MKELIQQFPQQLEKALQIAQSYKFKNGVNPVSGVLLTGLGGSGIGGSIVQNYVADKLRVPFTVNKNYDLPKFAGADTLVIICSYSGNTEETIESMKQAIKARAQVVCITSGGEVAALAEKKGLDCIIVPPGMPPRACIGYSIVQILTILRRYKLLKDKFDQDILASIALLNADTKDMQKKAKTIAQKLNGKLPIIYSAANYEGLAIRVRQQLNENSKILCWHNAIPEMNHNELVGWRQKDDNKVVIFLRNEDDYSRTQTRMEINKKVIRKYTPNIIELYSKGASYWEHIFYFIHLTDWVSVFLADLNGNDATEVEVINELKGALAKVK